MPERLIRTDGSSAAAGHGDGPGADAGPRRTSGVPHSAKAGFTFMELLVVILVISILSTLVGIAVRHIPAEARKAAARENISRFKVALEMYNAEQGNFPTQEQGLSSLCRKPETPPIPNNYPEGGYLDSLDVPTDPWKNDYVYVVPGPEGKPYEIISYGRDGDEGGEGEDSDISSLDLGM